MARNTHFRLPALGRLALPPLVERELRAGARRPLFYWLRGLLALAAGFQGYELLDHLLAHIQTRCSDHQAISY